MLFVKSYFMIGTLFVSDIQAQKSCMFSAKGIYQSEGIDVFLDKGDRIIYLYPTINPGGHYSASTGEYICPVSGMYFFQFSIYVHLNQARDYERGTAKLEKNGNGLAGIHIYHNSSEESYVTLSNAVIAQCSAGEKVWVVSNHAHNHLRSYHNLNSLSGFLISPQ